jgi:hypothetical protein
MYDPTTDLTPKQRSLKGRETKDMANVSIAK